MKVVSYEHLFGSNDIIAYCEDLAIEKDGIKYLPLDVVCEVGFHYETEDIQEVEFE